MVSTENFPLQVLHSLLYFFFLRGNIKQSFFIISENLLERQRILIFIHFCFGFAYVVNLGYLGPSDYIFQCLYIDIQLMRYLRYEFYIMYLILEYKYFLLYRYRHNNIF